MLERGDKIGDYTLARFLGRGQFGEVWLAEKELQLSTRKFQHALKFLLNLEDEINLKSAEAEIDTWIEASGHPNVMSVLDMIVHKDYVIIVSEFAEGGSLKGWLNKHGGKAPSHEKALKMMAGILSGIEHLHSRNVVHRDLKPDNILLQGKFPRITDFGISRIISAGAMSTVAMGSPFYMSPESFDGSKSTQTDIWSAGVILYEMLTGEYPYRADTIFALVTSIRQDEPKPLPDNIPPELKQIIMTALQKDLSKRFSTAQDMRSAIEVEFHNLKVRQHSQSGRLKTSIEEPALIDPMADTLMNAYFDIGSGNLESSEIQKEDYATNIENVIVQHSPNEITTRSLDSEVEVSQPIPPEVIWSQETQIAEIPKSNSVVEVDSGLIPEIDRENPPAVNYANRGLGNSQLMPTNRPLMAIAAIGSVVTLGLILVIFVIFGIKNELFFARSVENPNKATTDPLTTSAPPNDPKSSVPAGMKFIPGGTFSMGRDDAENPDEKPEHQVTVMPFYLDTYEVTNEEYARFVSENGHRTPSQWRNKTCPPGEERYPVVGVDWNDATAYAAWKGKRLPTEEEWEFAARGEDGHLYPWGNEWQPGAANMAGESRTLAEVGKFKGASPFDIYDMVGNAGEWTSSDFKAYEGGQLASRYTGKKNLKSRRGADFDTTKEFGTTTFRYGLSATGASYDLTGFRCAKDIDK